MNRTLIVYGTRRGTTERTADVIGETLVLRHGYYVEITNVRHIGRYRKRLHEFDNFIVGTSIVSGRWKWGILRFLKKHDFSNQRVAIFVTAGATMNKEKKYGLSHEEARHEAIVNFIDKYLPKFKFEPVSKTAFGGMVVRSGREKYNSWDRNEIESWAVELGKVLD